MDIFKKRLNEVLKENKINQSQLAKQLNIERQGITNYKNGNSIPSLDTFKNLCILLNTSADYLLGLEEYDGTKIEQQLPQQQVQSDSPNFNISTQNHTGNVNIKYK